MSLSLAMLEHLSCRPFPEGYSPSKAIHPEITRQRIWEHNYPSILKHTINKRILQTLRSIQLINSPGKNVPPRVSSAVVWAAYNGWPAASRCGRLRHVCPLCRSCQYDKLDHIMRCGVTRVAFSRYGVCQLPSTNRKCFFCAIAKVLSEIISK